MAKSPPLLARIHPYTPAAATAPTHLWLMPPGISSLGVSHGPPDLVPAKEASGPNRAPLSPSPLCGFLSRPQNKSAHCHRGSLGSNGEPLWGTVPPPHKAKRFGVWVSCVLEPEGVFWWEEVCNFGPLSEGTVRPAATGQRQELVPGRDGKYLPQMSAF